MRHQYCQAVRGGPRESEHGAGPLRDWAAGSSTATVNNTPISVNLRGQSCCNNGFQRNATLPIVESESIVCGNQRSS